MSGVGRLGDRETGRPGDWEPRRLAGAETDFAQRSPKGDTSGRREGVKPGDCEPWTKNQEPRTKNQEPRTKNQEPRTKNQEPRTTNHVPPLPVHALRPHLPR